MSTPIEIVREYRTWQRRPVMACGYTWNEPPHTQEEYDEALASVLADAERFKALERAHQNAGSGECWAVECNGGWLWDRKPLSELADRMGEETK